VISNAHDATVVIYACRGRIGKLANCAQNHRWARAAGPEYRTPGGEVGIICKADHVSRTIDGVTWEDEIGVNEFPSRPSQRHWRALASGPGHSMAFKVVCVATVAEDFAGSIDALGRAVWKCIAQLVKIDGRCVTVGPEHGPLH